MATPTHYRGMVIRKEVNGKFASLNEIGKYISSNNTYKKTKEIIDKYLSIVRVQNRFNVIHVQNPAIHVRKEVYISKNGFYYPNESFILNMYRPEDYYHENEESSELLIQMKNTELEMRRLQLIMQDTHNRLIKYSVPEIYKSILSKNNS